MKKIATKSYVQAQQQTVTFNPAMLKNVNQQQQNDPRVKAFQQAFMTLNINGFTALSQSDAILLDGIQQGIRKKLRMFGVKVGF